MNFFSNFESNDKIGRQRKQKKNVPVVAKTNADISAAADEAAEAEAQIDAAQ